MGEGRGEGGGGGRGGGRGGGGGGRYIVKSRLAMGPTLLRAPFYEYGVYC